MLKDFNFSKTSKMFLLFTVMSIITVKFLEFYCESFGYLSLMAKDRFTANPNIIFIVTPILFWLAAFLCYKYSPHSAGNSMNKVKDSMKVVENVPVDYNKLFIYLNFRIIIVKCLSSLLCVFGGGALGREGPAVHMATSFFAVIGHKYRSLLPKINIETWVFTGSALGLAVAFHAPLSGLFFIFEKLIRLKSYKYNGFRSWFKNKLLKGKSPYFLDTIFWSCVALAIYFILHKPKQMFNPADFIFTISLASLLPLFSLIILCAIIALFVSKIQNLLFNKISKIKSNWWHIYPILGGLLVAFISFNSGIYSFGGGVHTTEMLLNNNPISLIEVIARFANTIISYAANCAGGMVAPAIAMGASIGSLLGNIQTDINSNVFLLIGMVAFLSAIIEEPITAAIIIFEIAGLTIETLPILLFASHLAIFTNKASAKLIR